MQLGSPGSLPKLFAWLLCKPEGQLLTIVITQHLNLCGLGQDDSGDRIQGNLQVVMIVLVLNAAKLRGTQN